MVIKMLRIFLILSAILSVFALPRNGEFSGSRNTAEVISSLGYQAESHQVITSDGYILGMQRIPYKRGEVEGSPSRPVVFLMHGMLSASFGFIELGPEQAIAYNLADAGFDVWLGNARGNKNSRHHVTLNPDDPAESLQFFDYSWEEVAMYDVAAMVDYILELTGKDKLHYIGHSQGGTAFLVLNSMRVEYNEKIASAHLLAGVGYQDYFPNEELESLAALTDIIYAMAVGSNNIEVSPDLLETEPSKSYNKFDNCFGDIKHKSMCDLIGVRNYLRESDIPELENMGGGSLKQVAHYGQNIRDKTFRRWHHGSVQNQQVYGSEDPPTYDLSLITVNVTMHYTINDSLLDERDVLAMAADMPNTVVRKVARDSFLHEDFAIAPDVKELVTDYVIEAMLYVEERLLSDSDDNEESNDTNQDNESNQDTDAGAGENEPVLGSSSNVVLSLICKISLITLCFKTVLTYSF